jgi:MFS transporter, DHA1 family, inner membrane transport protein
MNRKERMIIIILAGLNFTHMLDFMILMPLGNYLMPYFKITAQEFSILVAAYSLSAAISGFAAAFFVDRFDRKRILLFGYIGFLAGTIACGFAPNYPVLLGARIFAGIFGGLIGAQVLSIVADMFGYERRGVAMGYIISSFAVASIVGVPFALYLANLFSWHVPFLMVGFVGIIVTPFIIKYIPPMTEHMKEAGAKRFSFDVLTNILSVPQQRNALIFSAMIMLGHFLIIPFLNPFLEFNVGYSKHETPLIYLVGGSASFLAAPILGRLADRYGKLVLFTICILLSLAVVWSVTHWTALPLWVALAVIGFWFILGAGRMITANAMISNVVSAEHRGSFMSFNSSVQQLGTSMASLLAGFVVVKQADNKIQHYDWTGYLSIGVLFAALILARQLFGKMDGKKTSPSKRNLIFHRKVNGPVV